MKQNPTLRRGLGVLLSLVLCLSLLPAVALAAGTDTGKAIQLGTGCISGYDSTDGYDYIYFGYWNAPDAYTTSGPIKWRVLDDQTNTGTTGLFLLSEVLFGSSDSGGVYFQQVWHKDSSNIYHKGDTPAGDDHSSCQLAMEWQNSDAQSWCNTFESNNLDSLELAAILDTMKDDEAHSTLFGASAGILNNDKVFFLSGEEAETDAYGFTDDSSRIAKYSGAEKYWWLRSPHSYVSTNAGAVEGTGIVCGRNLTIPLAARPAFNLDSNAVLFASAAEDGKSAAGMDSGLTAVTDYTGSEWKLTLLDSSRSFSVAETTASGAPGDTITLNYTGATAGTNEYISAIIADSSGAQYYGRLKNITADTEASGTVSLTIPSGLADGTYTLSVFSEQYNGDKKTDFASAFDTVTLTVESPVNYGFKIMGQNVTSANINSFTSTGSISYAADTKTLTLTNATIEGTVPTNAPSAMLYCDTAVEVIKLEGSNVITGNAPASKPSGLYGIFANKSLTIKGTDCTDSLKITMPEWDDSTSGAIFYTRGINVEGNSSLLMIQECTLDVVCAGGNQAEAATNAIFAGITPPSSNNSITIQNAKINAVIGKHRDGDIFNAKGGTAIYAKGGTLKIIDSDVTAYAFSSHTNPGYFTSLEGGAIELSGCTLDLKVTVTGTNSNIRRVLYTSGANGVKIRECTGTMTSPMYGIQLGSTGGLNIKGSVLTITGETNAVYGLSSAPTFDDNTAVKSGADVDSATDVDLNSTTEQYWRNPYLAVLKSMNSCTVDSIPGQTYNGTAQKPTVTVKFGDAALTKGTDYTVSYENNTNVGTATAVITGMGNYSGELRKDFTINKKPITVTPNGGQSKTYGESDPTLTYTLSEALCSGDSMSGALSRVAGDDVGTYAINLGDLSAGGNYTLSLSTTPVDFTITPKSIAGMTVTLSESSKVYSGSDQTVTVTSVGTLTDSDYDVTAGTTGKDAATYTVTVTGKGNYTGTASAQWTITPKSITVTPNGGQSKTYGESDPTLTYTLSEALCSGDSMSGALGRVAGDDAGTYAINLGTLSVGGNYTLSLSGTPVNFTINKKPITVTPNGGQSKTYGESDPTLTYTLSEALCSGDGMSGALGRVAGDDVGTYAINLGTLSAGGNYTLSLSGTPVNFTINKKPITVTPNGGQSKTYGESDPTLTYTLSEALCSGDSMSGALGRAAGDDVGTYAINLGDLSAGGNYTLSLSTTPVDFTITPKSIAIATATATSRNYAAGDVSVETDVTFNGTISTLTKNTDYTVTGQMDDENAGTGKTVDVTVTLIGRAENNYTLTANTTTTTVTINPRPVAETDFTTLGTASMTYTGSEHTQTIESATLALDTDYTVTYADNVYAGTNTAKYTIAGIGNYSGSFEKTFSIAAVEYDRTGVLTALESGGTYTADTIKNAIPNAGDVTIAGIKVMKTDGTEVTGANADAIAVFDPAAQTVRAVSAGKVEITYNIAANNVDGSGDAEYSAADGRTVEVTISAAPSSGGVSTYAVTVDSAVNGTVTVSPKNASRGSTVTITVTPDTGYELDTLTVTDASGNEIELTDKGDGKYTFKMPSGRVTITATFLEQVNFVDVPADAYYYDAVRWAVRNGITNGTGDGTTFHPDAPCNRAQIVTFLWRSAGCPEPESMSSFADVPADSYYAKAVAWAVEQGITTGTGDGQFSPNAVCTRAQAMAFLWRSQKSAAPDGVNSFTDVAADAYYAKAVQWAAENGITTGTSDTTFSPDNDCTRAQIVTFLYRCLGE